MSSYLHELLILLFRNRDRSAPELLQKLDGVLPAYDEVRFESSDLGNLRPAEYRADLVLFLVRSSHKVLGIIVEVQMACDDDKPYAWPAYVANLRARHRCPVCLLVVTTEEAVARWAARCIDLGPGATCTPFVIGPSNTPSITELGDANENVELAVLSVIEYARSTDNEFTARIISAAILSSAAIDDERSRLYLDAISLFLAETAPQALRATMNRFGYEYKSDFARRYFVEGKAEGRVDLILKLLSLRFGPLTDVAQNRIRSAQDAQRDIVAERVLTAQTLEEALVPLS